MIHATYITHDGAVQYTLGFNEPTETWQIQTALMQNDFELYPGGIEWCDDEWHARARFERLVADDITDMQEKEVGA